MDNSTIVYLLLIGGTVFLLSQSLIIPVFGEGKKIRSRLKVRLDQIDEASELKAIGSIMREKYLRSLSPWEAKLESIPAMESLARMIEQAGHRILAYRLVILSVGFAFATAIIIWVLTRVWPATVFAGVLAFALPYWKINRDRNNRLATFEEQMPEGIDVMRRALMAGHPFNAALNLVADDMQDPLAREFRLTFADLNYGNDIRRALLGLLSRVPSVTVMAFVTSVLVQKETGGNLAEILSQISGVIRGRYKFQRRVRTLSAEGRMSAQVLAMVPVLLVGTISITTPDYIPSMYENPTGRQVLLGTIIWASIGILIIRRMLRIEV